MCQFWPFMNLFIHVKCTRQTSSLFSPPWVSPQGVLEPQTWWIPPGWEGTSHRGHSAGCWVLPHFREWPGRQQTLPEETIRWPYQEESRRKRGHLWNTVSQLNCWSPLMKGINRIFVFSKTNTDHRTYTETQGALPDVVRGRVPRWLHVGGVLLLGGEPTVKRTIRGLAEPVCTSPLGPAGASTVEITFITMKVHAVGDTWKIIHSQILCRTVDGLTCVHGFLHVKAICAALVGLSAQSDSDWLLRQATSTYRSAVKSNMSCKNKKSNWRSLVSPMFNFRQQKFTFSIMFVSTNI